jgi:ABC-type nitrate/sulfonate/bicarbonate transport system ATPase subunit
MGGRLMAKVTVRNLVKEFPAGRRQTVRAIDDVDLHVGTGEFVCIVGASGCGKSTLLNIVAGLDTATSGAVEVDGDTVVGPGPDRGMVFQAYSLYPWKTVAENVAFGLEVAGMPRGDRDERVTELLNIVGLKAFADHLPKELSGGMRQRVAIARALAPEPDVLLLDEPFGALDAQTKRSMQEFLRTLWQRTRATILMVTHDVQEAVYLSDRIYVMTPRPGRVAEVVDVPFGTARGPSVKRDPRFLDLVDEIEDLLHTPQTDTAEPEEQADVA